MLVVALMNLIAGLTNLDPGWPPPQDQIDSFAVVVAVFGAAGVAGAALWNRVPPYAGALVLVGVWVPLFAPAVNMISAMIAAISGTVGHYASGPSVYLEPLGPILAVLAAVGAIQNIVGRPIVRRPRAGQITTPTPHPSGS